jgi:hypothetical protein
MYYSVRVRVCEGGSNLTQQEYCGRNRQLTNGSELRSQGPPFDKRHREIREASSLTSGEDGNYVRVLELSGNPDLPPEAFDAHISGHIRMQHLDDYGPAEGGFHCHEDTAHTAAAELTLDPVAFAECFLELLA